MAEQCLEAITAVLDEAVAPCERALSDGAPLDQVLRGIVHSQRMTLELLAVIHAEHEQ